MVINTEKLEAMTEVEMRRLPGLDRDVGTIWTEAGVVTQRVADAAERAGFVFAVTRPAPKPRALAATSP